MPIKGKTPPPVPGESGASRKKRPCANPTGASVLEAQRPAWEQLKSLGLIPLDEQYDCMKAVTSYYTNRLKPELKADLKSLIPAAKGSVVEPRPSPAQTQAQVGAVQDFEICHKCFALTYLPAAKCHECGHALDPERPGRQQVEKSQQQPPPGQGKQQQQKEPLTFEQRWQALEQYASELASTEWPTVKALAAIAGRASELEVNRLTQRNLEQLLEAAQRGIRATSAPILPGGTFEVNPTPWAVDGLFRHGLNLLVGQSGAGKSRLMAALMAAWLRGDQTWLQRELKGPPVADRHALIIGTDQGREDWHQTLTPVGLCTLLPDGMTVQLHDRLSLYAMESGAVLDADTMRMIRRWVDEHPGGMVGVDALATCLPPGVDEDKSSAAGPVHALQDAISGGWGVLTHHTRKGAGKEGNLGVGAGRGSGAIDAAVSRVIGLGLIHKMESGQLLPQESDPRRELLSTKRGGPTVHLIIASDHTGAWDCHGSAEELKRQQRQEQVMEHLTETQREILAALEDNEGKTMTARDVVEALGHDWGDGTGSKPASIRRTMRTLATKKLLVCRKVGTTLTFSLPDDEQG
jgi:ribosomal protein L40E